VEVDPPPSQKEVDPPPIKPRSPEFCKQLADKYSGISYYNVSGDRECRQTDGCKVIKSKGFGDQNIPDSGGYRFDCVPE
tara:strand:- start:3312 stop:3548 length:237 start_codon:yes stop_codon:yes gene_type:complete